MKKSRPEGCVCFCSSSEFHVLSGWFPARFPFVKVARRSTVFDQYQMLLARQLASADWSKAVPGAQKAPTVLLIKVRGADEEDEAIGFTVFDAAGRRVFHDNETAAILFTGRSWDGLSSNASTVKMADRMDCFGRRGKYTIAVGQELEYREETALDIAEEFLYPWLGGLLVLLAASIWFYRSRVRAAAPFGRRF